MAKNSNRIIIVQGAQYGSEAKGAVCGWMAEHENVEIMVRTGATNAGHTVYYQGQPVKMQQLPVGWVNPDCQLVLGAGALIDPAILARECEEVTRLTGSDIRKRLLIDYRAGVHGESCAKRSANSGRHHAIGATGKGCSEALIDRIRGRGTGYKRFGDEMWSDSYTTADTADVLNRAFDGGAKILLEGTQGTMLDLYLGPYPYVTHKQTLPAQWMLECGLSPALATDIVSVIRMFPIRVAGNSGPLPGEITWPTLARRINDVRIRQGLEPIVSGEALTEFERAIQWCVEPGDTRWATGLLLPKGRTGLDQHLWTELERVTYAETLSELNRAALSNLSPATLTELSKLFEFTTVTKKLRRVANLDLSVLRRSAQLVRPHRLALTFMNYSFPEWWYQAPTCNISSVWGMGHYIDMIQQASGGARAFLLGFGPESHHHVAR